MFVNTEIQQMRRLSAIAVILSLATPPLFASQELAEKNGCMGCHLMDQKTVGPAIRQIAEKYSGQKDVAPLLLEKVKNGGGGYRHGVWGQVPMPPNPQVNDDDLKIILTWMLEQK
jgi:cytochrome c